jgi:hypothetical protein
MDTNRTTARVVGALFLIAMVASLAGGVWLESITSASDSLTAISTSTPQVITGVLLELINGIAVVGIAVVIYPVLRRHHEVLALGYVAFRLLEAAVIIAAVISPLSLLTLSQEYLAAGAANASYYQAAGAALIAARTQIVGLLIPVFFGLSALIFYVVLYRSRLVPQFISVWGIIGVILMLAWNLLEAYGIHVSIGMVLALPIILNEIFLGLWLIARGFNPSAIAFGSAE